MNDKLKAGEILVPTVAVEGAVAVQSNLRAKIIRADGTVEDVGMIAYWDKNPLKRWWFKVRKAIFGKVK